MVAKKRDGIVYSTDPNFKYPDDSHKEEKETLPPSQQMLYVWLESKGRNGKTVTLVKGFAGKEDDLDELAGKLKRYCGTGGSVKDGEIIIQGDFRNKVLTFLTDKGFKCKKAGG
ncbi:MAG TPA: translation initiation factor [Bacteroidales bacterium]|nr:translation initiation factor [Bacteroidales bacterium]